MVSDSEVFSSGLPSGDGSYVKELTKKDEFTQVPFEKRAIPEVQFEQKKPIVPQDRSKLKEFETSQQYDRYGVPITQFPSVPREGYLAAPSQKIEKKAEFEQKKEEFEKQVPGFLKPSVETIDKNFLSRKPSFVVDDLNRQYKDAGFEFTGSDFYETVQVKAPNGKTLNINTNVYTGYVTGINVEDEAERLKFFIKENAASIGAEKIAKLQKDYEQGKQSFLTQKQIDDEAKRLNDEAMAFVDEKNQFLAETDALQALNNRLESYPEAQRNTAEYNTLVNDYNAKVIEYQKKAKDLDAKMQGIADKEGNLKKTAGEYTKFKAQQGGFTGYLWRQATDAMGNIVSGWYEFAVDRKFDILPLNLLLGKENYEFNRKRKMEDLGLDPDKVNLTPSYFDKLSDAEKRYAVLESSRLNKQIDESIRDDYKKIQKYGKLDYKGLGEIKFEGGITSDDIREYFTKTIGTLNTTKEYQERINEEGTLIQRGLGGFAGSIPAMMGGSFMRIANMYMLNTDAVAKEMQDDPDFKDVSESEKELIKGSIGVVSALLEEIGFRNAIKGKAIIGNITKRVLGRVGTNVTSNALRSSALDVIKEMSLRGGLRVLGGGLAEAETGALQQMNEFGVKDIYNAVKGKKMFDTPQTVGEYVGKVLDASGTESIGGFVTSIPSAVSSAFEKDGFQGLNDDTFKMFEELSKANDSKKFFVIDLKNKINEGKITKAEADNILANYDKSAGLVQQIPDEITDVNERKKAMDLLKDRKALEDKIQGKDPALSKPIQNQINNINEQLNAITENAIQKQTAGEVPVQPEAGTGEEVVQREPQSKPETAPQQVEPTVTETKEEEVTPEVTEEQVVTEKKTPITISQSIESGKVYNREGDKGKIKQEGQIVILEKANGDVIELGNIDEVKDRPISDFNINETIDIILNDDNSFDIDGKKYVNNYNNTESAISVDKNGNYSVTLDTPDGQKRTFRGERGEEMAYQIKLKQLESETNEQTIDRAIQLTEEIIAAETKPGEVTTKEEVGVTRETKPTKNVITEKPTKTFTEQDKARQKELKDALNKADKRKKNITVGETVMPKADVKAELDALNQKELSSTKPEVTAPKVEVTPTETAPTKTMTPEQEADLLEERLKQRKKERAAETKTEVKEEQKVTEKKETENEKTAKRIRGKKMKGTLSTLDFGITQTVYNGSLEFMARQVEKGTKIGEAITATINWIDAKVGNIKWDKESFSKYMNTVAESMTSKRKAKEILDVYPKGSTVSIVELAKETTDDIVSNVLTKMKDVFKSVKISGRRPTEGAAFYNYNTKEIDINKNSPHWNEVEGDQISSALSHEFTHHLIDAHPEKESIENELQQIKDDLIVNKPELADNQKQAYEFMTAKNNSPQEILTYAVSNPYIRQILEKYKNNLNNISNKIFGQDVISGKFEEQKIKENEKVQSQRKGDRGGRTESRAITPLEGAPSVPGFTGPDSQLVAVAEEYARENGIPYKRQAEYVKVDEGRAKRIAQAYEDMKHDPQNTKVKEAYENLIKQTIAQYEALVKAGYKFWFINTNIPSNQEYAQSPFNAMRDIRNNKEMGVFPTTDGFGSSDIDVKDNPLMVETKFKWPVGGVDGQMKPVLANDLFRAVHDAFGHGLEGSGFRARGEENAWQAHIRLFTGSAVGAITSETRGQNSWLNFGPYGETNRTANTEDTVFADQKTGLMPEWTWKEGVSPDMKEEVGKEKMPSISDAVRSLKIKGPGGLQSNILGVPIAIWNAAVETVASAIDAGTAIAEALKKGYNELKDYKRLNGKEYEIEMLKSLYDDLIQEIKDPNSEFTKDGAKEYLIRQGLTENQANAVLEIKPKAEKKPISKEKIVGKPKPKKVTVNDMTALKDQIALEIKAAKDGAKSVADAIKAIVEYVKKMSNRGNLTRKDLIKILNIIPSVKDQGTLNKAANAIYDIIKNATTDIVEVSDYKAMISQIALEIRAAREAKGDLNAKRKMLAAAIKDMVKKGKITIRQAAVLINKVNNTNLDNPVMVERLLNYADKVFSNAEYSEKIARAKKLLTKAKENVRTKIGVSEGLTTLMNKLFNINPNLIPDDVLEAYLELVDMMGKRQAVLTLKESADLTKDVEKILDSINDELSTLDELIDIFEKYDDKVLDENGDIDFAATIEKMLEEGIITASDAKIYKKYKDKVLPEESKEKKTEAQIAEEKKNLIDAVQQTQVNENALLMREERDAARKLFEAITPSNLQSLTNTELKNLLKLLDNISNGFLPHYAVIMTQKLNASNRSKTLNDAVSKAGRLPLTKLIANIKALFPGAKTANMIMVIESPKYVIDQVFGYFKTTPIYNSVFKPLTEAFASYKNDVKKAKEKLDKAFNKVANSYLNNPVKIKMSQFKMMTYALQLEYESNKDKGEGFYSAVDYIRETIKHARGKESTMSKKDIELLERILQVYGVKDADNKVVDIDINKLYNSLNNAEKEAIKTIKEVNMSIRDKAMFTSAVIRGDKMKPIDNYIHHNVLPTGITDTDLRSVSDDMNVKMMPSTRAKTLKERTKGAKPLDFNIFGATQRSANQVLMDFHLTEAVRTSRMVLNEARKELQEKGNDKDISILDAIESSFEKVLQNTLMNTFNESTFADKTISMITKQSYRILLASAKRWTAELISNLAYIGTVNPKAYLNGITKYSKYVMSEKGPAILRNINSGAQDRVYEDSVLSGRMIDNSMMNEAIGLSGTTSNYAIVNAMQVIHNNTTKKVQNFVATTADTLISTPDKISLRPFYFGVFAQNFKKETGQEVDFDKIAENDEAYLKKFKEAIDKSKEVADSQTMLAGGTKNPFAARQKAMSVKGAGAFTQIYQSFNNFMNSFIINEYIAARTGIYAMMGNGRVSQRQGAAMLAGVIARTTLYTLLIKEIGRGLSWLILGGDDEEDEEKSIIEKTGQAFAGSMTSLILGRDFGNLTRNMINYGVEKVNENYVQKMIDGQYSKDDVIAFNNLIPNSLSGKPNFSDLMIIMSGAGQPFLRSLKTLYETTFADEAKREETIKKREIYWKYTLPLEVAGYLGFVPIYKDVKSVAGEVLKEEADAIIKEKEQKKIEKTEAYGGFKTIEELEIADPKKYKELSKKGGALYEFRKKDKAQRKANEEKKAKEYEEKYGVKPKPKKGGSREGTRGGDRGVDRGGGDRGGSR